MPASIYVESNSLTMWLQGAQSASLPSAVYVGLFLTNPTGAGTGTEVSGNGYTRVAASFGTPAQSGTGMVASNTSAVQFPTAEGSWGTPQYFALYDAQTGGNLLFYAALPTTFAITSGMAPRFAVGALSVSAT